MKSAAMLVQEFAQRQGGVFSRPDLEVLFQTSTGSSMARKLEPLFESGQLRRFSRGWYITRDVSLPVLFQRIAPNGYVSLDWALSRHGIIGVKPQYEISGIHPDRPNTYGDDTLRVVAHQAASHLVFGFEEVAGVRYADAEKAVLDTLSLHTRGHRFVFDVYSDINFAALNLERVESHLGAYRNPKFVTFAKTLIWGATSA